MIQVELHSIVKLQEGAPPLGLIQLAGNHLLLELVGLERVLELEVSAVQRKIGQV